MPRTIHAIKIVACSAAICGMAWVVFGALEATTRALMLLGLSRIDAIDWTLPVFAGLAVLVFLVYCASLDIRDNT